MTDKKIRNEQWYVNELISKINKKDISKPQFQRKRKWDIHPKKENNPNEKNYIKFLYDTENSVHAITFGEETDSEKIYSNIDGNNRINAIKHFIDKPFEIFNEYLDNLIHEINKLPLNQEDKERLITIFSNLSYSEIMDFKYNHYFNKNGFADLYPKIQIHRDFIEDELIEDIKTKLKIKSSRRFDLNVKINVNIFRRLQHG